MSKNCKTCVYDGSQMLYPSRCTGCGVQSAKIFGIDMTHPTTLPRDQLEQAYLKLEAERDKLKEEREQREKQEPYGWLDSDSLFIKRGFIIFHTGQPLYAHPPVPDGKVLVPIEPTDYELEELRKAIPLAAWDYMDYSILKQLHKAMLKAAQQGE